MTIQQAGLDELQAEIIRFAINNGYSSERYNPEGIAKELRLKKGGEQFEVFVRALDHYTENKNDNPYSKFDRYNLNYGDIVSYYNGFTRNQKPVVNQFQPEKPAWQPSKEQTENQLRFTYLVRFYDYYLESDDRNHVGWEARITTEWIKKQPFSDTFYDEMDILTVREEIVRQMRSKSIQANFNNSRVLSQNIGGNMRTIKNAPNLTDRDIDDLAYLISHYKNLEAANASATKVLKEHNLMPRTDLYPFEDENQLEMFNRYSRL